MIQLVDVHKRLGNNEVLQGLNLHVRPGETYAIIGRSGTGKSVTLKHIVGLLQADRGQVFVAGSDLSTLPKAEFYILRKKMGVLFQSGALLNWLSVGENVALPLREHERFSEREIHQRVKAKLALVELHDVESLMPDSISGGMKKRVGLARAIVRDPEIILYDEPTSGLDPVMSNQINELIRSLQEKLQVTSICVTHDMSSAYQIASRIGMLYQGKIIAEGSPQEIQHTDNAIVRQFIEGRTSGPLTNSSTD